MEDALFGTAAVTSTPTRMRSNSSFMDLETDIQKGVVDVFVFAPMLIHVI